MPDDVIKDSSPFPSHSDMDLDMWRANAHPNPDGSRNIEAPGDWVVCKVFASADRNVRDLTARRIEMVGDLYETLRVAADKLAAAGIDVAQEHEVLAEFLAPKPFPGA